MKLLIAFITVLMTTIVWASEDQPISEEQIPVNISTVKKASASENYMGRMVMVVGVMTVVAGAAYYFAKKYGKPGQSQHTQIKVLTQHYLGPKKSLAIVRVAGESILVGITDHSINMIKSLSLLDDEIPETTEPNFEKALEDQEKVQQSGSEEFSIGHIKDIVSLKLKGMRNDL